MSNFWQSVLIGALVGAIGGFQWWWSPWERRRRRRHIRAFRRMLAARSAIYADDPVAALVHLTDAINMECGEDVLPFDKYMLPDWIEK